MVWKLAGEPPSVSSQRGGRCRLTKSPTTLEQRQDPGALASPQDRADTHRARLYRARAPAAAAASSRCRRLCRTILQTPAPPPHNMSAATATGTAADAWERIRTEPGTGGAAGAAGVAV